MRLRQRPLVLVGLVLIGACAPPRGKQLCDAIAKRDVATVQQLLAGPPLDLTLPNGTCVPAAAAFGAAKPGDAKLTDIGIELLKAGLPPDASWVTPDHPDPVWAIEIAAGNDNRELVRALIAVGLDVKSRESTRALVQAAGAGRLAIVQLLVLEGADLDATSGGETALERATANGRADVVRYIEGTIEARAAALAKPPA